MSTRCQVQVKDSGLPGWTEKVTLYHHSDGYPSHMLPCIMNAYKIGNRPPEWASGNCQVCGSGRSEKRMDEPSKYTQSWQLGRAGYVAGMLCAAHVGSFQPESGHQLHRDIEYFYVIEANNGRSTLPLPVPEWHVKVYVTRRGFGSAVKPSVKANMHLVAEGDIRKLAAGAKQIEDIARKYSEAEYADVSASVEVQS